LEALKHLPRGLSEVFDQKLRRVRDRTAAEDAMKMLQLCGVAKRPLTVMEYQEALSLSPGQRSLDRGKFTNDMDRIISDCCGLTFLDEEENTVHYVHHSVKQHLFATNGPHSAEFHVTSVDRHLGFLCMTYLDFTDFKRQLTKVKAGSSTLIKPLQLGILPICRSSSVTSGMALKLLSYRRQLQHLSARELERKAQELLGDVESSQLELEIQRREFQFLGYARTYWLSHLTDLHADTDSMMWRLFCRCVEGNDILACRPWESEQETHGERNDIPKSVQWLLAHGHYALLLYQVRHQSHILTENVKYEILHNAAIHDRYRFIEVIVQLSNNTSKTLNHGLLYAAREGCNNALASLLRAGADVNVQVCDRTAVQAAAEGGHLEVVERLLAAKADVNARAADENGRTALRAAAEGGHLEVVERLLAAKADVNAPAGEWDGRTALQAAAEGGHLEVVERLLAAKADVNAPAADDNGRTALQAAAEGGHLEVVERLLAAKADVNAHAADDNGRTALRAAAQGGHLEVVESLKQTGARL
jgi:ankyrin repeat protein